MRPKQVPYIMGKVKHTRYISMCAGFPSSVGYASFSLLHLPIIRFLVYWLITPFDLIVSIPCVLRPSRLSVAKKGILWSIQTPILYLKHEHPSVNAQTSNTAQELLQNSLEYRERGKEEAGEKAQDSHK